MNRTALAANSVLPVPAKRPISSSSVSAGRGATPARRIDFK
jgi:hypothetical protein